MIIICEWIVRSVIVLAYRKYTSLCMSYFRTPMFLLINPMTRQHIVKRKNGQRECKCWGEGRYWSELKASVDPTEYAEELRTQFGSGFKSKADLTPLNYFITFSLCVKGWRMKAANIYIYIYMYMYMYNLLILCKESCTCVLVHLSLVKSWSGRLLFVYMY